MLLTGVLSAGCLAVPRLTTTVHEDSRVRILLATFAEASRTASHPVVIDPHDLRALLAGVALTKVVDPLVAAVSDPVTVPAFTEAEASLLAPLLGRALSQATPEEEVVFSLFTEAGTGRTVTEGSLFVGGHTASFTLTRFRAPAEEPPLLSAPTRSFARPSHWRLRFHPETALAPQTTQPAESTLPATVTVERARLTDLADAPPHAGPTRPAAVEEDVRRLRDRLERQEERLKRLEQERELR